mgnify:FL=1
MSEQGSVNVGVWDILFYKIDEEGEEIRNPDGTVKIFGLKDSIGRDFDFSYIAESFEEDELEEIKEPKDEKS